MTRRRLLPALALLLAGAAGWSAWRHVRQAQLDAALVAAVDANAPARVNALLDQGADPNARPVAKPAPVWQGLVDTVLGRRRTAGMPALLRATERKHWTVAEALAARGADPNVSDRGGRTPLLFAVAAGRAQLARLLLDNGAAIPVVVSVSPRPPAVNTTLVSLAAASGDEAQALELTRLLLARGANPEDGRALGAAIFAHRPSVAQLLLSRGANPNAPVSSRSDAPYPLGCAAFEGDEPLVRLLLVHGADPTLRDRAAKSAGYHAATPLIRRLLLHAEADWRRKHPAAGPARPAAKEGGEVAHR